MAAYQEWAARVEESNVTDAFKPILTAMTNWGTEIFNYFDFPVTNAYPKSLNSITRYVKRMGRSYSFEALRAKMLYSDGLHKKHTPKFKKSSFMRDLIATPTLLQNYQTKDFGVDISMLIKALERGDF